MEIDQRKNDHINLTKKSQVLSRPDDRFFYEPLMGAHPQVIEKEEVFLGKKVQIPLWVSSMTGGGKKGQELNELLAEATRKFGLGMGLGSCRVLLEDEKKYWSHFNLRPILGKDRPFWANLGIAQVEELISNNKIEKLEETLSRLDVDGLIIHINPLQEFFQKEGDLIKEAPIITIEKLLKNFRFPIIVKEVGQGMGPLSIQNVMKMGVAGIELAAFGGTNFTRMEGIRSGEESSFEKIGHEAFSMIKEINKHKSENTHIIISGGIRDIKDAFFLRSFCQKKSVIGQASRLLTAASEGENALFEYIRRWGREYRLAENYLRLKWN